MMLCSSFLCQNTKKQKEQTATSDQQTRNAESHTEPQKHKSLGLLLRLTKIYNVVVCFPQDVCFLPEKRKMQFVVLFSVLSFTFLMFLHENQQKGVCFCFLEPNNKKEHQDNTNKSVNNSLAKIRFLFVYFVLLQFCLFLNLFVWFFNCFLLFSPKNQKKHVF